MRNLGDAKAFIHQLDDMHQRCWEDFRQLRATMKKLGVADFDNAMMKPNEALLKFYEDVAGL